jgi:hypothetical protein
MDARISTEEYIEFRSVLAQLLPDKAARDKMAERCKVHPKTLSRLGRSLPSPLQPFICEPELLRALLRDLDRRKAA